MSETPVVVYRAAAEAALRRHVGDGQVDGLSAEYLDGLITDWWDTPDSRARVDAAYAAGREAERERIAASLEVSGFWRYGGTDRVRDALKDGDHD